MAVTMVMAMVMSSVLVAENALITRCVGIAVRITVRSVVIIALGIAVRVGLAVS